MKGLLLYAETLETKMLSYNDDWFDAFLKCADLDWDQCNLATKSWMSFLFRIRQYDIIVLLHSTNSNGNYVHPLLQKALLYRKGKVVLFVGNEYKLMPEKIRFIKIIEVDYVSSQLPLDTAEWLYGETSAKVVSVPHALNPEVFKPQTRFSDRLIDFGDRSADYPLYLGDIDRNRVPEVLSRFEEMGLLVDSSRSADKRFDRAGWANFLNTCKATMTTEAGTSFLERDDRTRLAVNAFNKEKPEAGFDEIFQIFFAHYNNAVSGKTISPRHFDAIGTKTCQIMFPGRFCDILEKGKHYISLEQDLSNIREVIDMFQDRLYVERMVANTYEYAMEQHTHRHRINKLLGTIYNSHNA